MDTSLLNEQMLISAEKEKMKPPEKFIITHCWYNNCMQCERN